MKNNMRNKALSVVAVFATLILAGCAQPPPQQFVVQQPDEQKPQTITFPNGTVFGGASATGSMSVNQKLSRERSEAPEPIINQYLVNVPHQFYKVYGLGDLYARKNVSLQEDQRYQNVRISAVYDTNQIPALRS